MKRLCLLAVATLMALSEACAAEWQRLSARLMTPWGENIDPENVWQEYPRPQLVRDNWMNLNGVWDYFRRTNSVKLTYEEKASRFTEKILVPFGVESALSGIMHTDYSTTANSTLMYRRTFTMPENFQGKRILLHFGAVDWQCAVFVNGTQVGEHKGGSDPFTFDITNFLQASGEQELQVAVYDPSSRGGQPNGKQTVSPSGIWYTSCSGIWQTVWLEAVGKQYVQRYELVPDAETGSVRVRVFANDPSCKFSLIARDGEQIVATSDKVRVGEEVTLVIPDAKLWTPDTPFLYDLDIVLCTDDCQECDRARGYFGLRTLTKALVDGQMAFLLNGKPLFMFGPLDQGWWPDGLLTPPSYEAMVYDLKTIKSLGMNMVRKHIKVENDLWYEWCDRNGLIVWQDMPSGGSSGSLGTKEEIQHNFYQECEHIVTALKQHPCIGVWVPYNEGWGQDASAGGGHTIRGHLVVRNADADHGRLMNTASGWTDFKIGDILDRHNYPAPSTEADSRKERVAVCGEYGGITLMVEGHLWAGSQQTYTQVSNSEDYTERFNQYTGALQGLQQSRQLWGAVYTQITDVEQEVNGILTYDRKVLKVNEEQLASIRAKIEQTINCRLSSAESVLPAGDNDDDIVWSYTTNEPEEGWEKPDYDCSSWKNGKAGFGKIDQAAARVRTTWSTPEIWIRRNFQLEGVTQEQLPALCLRIFYDEDSEVYINGVLAMTTTGYNTSYQLFEISEAARKTIRLNGENTIAIHTKQTSGGQYIDAGFSLRTFKSNAETTIKPMTAVKTPEIVEDPARAYLLTYTTSAADGIHYASSFDGFHWTELNSGESVFANLTEEETVKDPFVLRMEDESGKPVFHLVHALDDAKGLYHWKSSDLMSWEPINGTDGQVVNLKVNTPEIGYDSTSTYYIYHWSTINGTTYAARYSRTKDFVKFTKPAEYFNTNTSVKDLHVFPNGKTYVAVFADPEGSHLLQATCKTQNPGIAKFSNVTEAVSNFSVDRPLTIPALGGDGWFLVTSMEQYRLLYSAMLTASASPKWQFMDDAICEMPEDMRDGKVTIISRAELEALNTTIENIRTGVLPQLPLFRPSPQQDAIYNVAGQQVARRSQLKSGTLSPGVYIVAGKKILVK